jgi:hypothetical protein
MRELTRLRRFRPITQEDIEAFEKKNLLMPNYLREFFKKYNGAKIKENFHKSANGNYIVSILPLLKDDLNTSVEDLLPFVNDFELGIGRKDLIPFAIDPGGRPFLVSTGNNDNGKVYYSIVGLGFSEPLRKIADSFEEFINGLEPEP